jgi:uncharacterized membrane protein
MTAVNLSPGRTAGRTDGAGHWRGDGSSHGEPARSHDLRLANFLGWFSIGLGLTEILATRQLAKFIGVTDNHTNRTVLRLFGLREVVAGVGILSTPRPAAWVWGRVAGDAMDLTALGTALASGAPRPDKVLFATASVAGVTALDIYDAIQLSQHPSRTEGVRGWSTIEVKKATTVAKPAEELYRYWRDFQNLPRFMSHLQSVQVVDDRRSHWKTRGPAGTSVEWDAEIVEDRPNERIAWRSTNGSIVENSGSVNFVPAPGGRGTEVHVDLTYKPPGGLIGAAVAKMFGESPEQQVYDDLRLFKEVMETGEVLLSESSYDGTLVKQRPAQPLPNGWSR